MSYDDDIRSKLDEQNNLLRTMVNLEQDRQREAESQKFQEQLAKERNSAALELLTLVVKGKRSFLVPEQPRTLGEAQAIYHKMNHYLGVLSGTKEFKEHVDAMKSLVYSVGQEMYKILTPEQHQKIDREHQLIEAKKLIKGLQFIDSLESEFFDSAMYRFYLRVTSTSTKKKLILFAKMGALFFFPMCWMIAPFVDFVIHQRPFVMKMDYVLLPFFGTAAWMGLAELLQRKVLNGYGSTYRTVMASRKNELHRKLQQGIPWQKFPEYPDKKFHLPAIKAGIVKAIQMQTVPLSSSQPDEVSAALKKCDQDLVEIHEIYQTPIRRAA